VPTPLKEFAGSARVTLRPGQSERVTVAIDPLSLSFWDVAAHAWRMPAGQVPILVGSSSRTIVLQGTLQVHG
jgi:beta-glucosidase